MPNFLSVRALQVCLLFSYGGINSRTGDPNMRKCDKSRICPTTREHSERSPSALHGRRFFRHVAWYTARGQNFSGRQAVLCRTRVVFIRTSKNLSAWPLRARHLLLVYRKGRDLGTRDRFVKIERSRDLCLLRPLEDVSVYDYKPA